MEDALRATSAPAVVLDTNAVLDWLVFTDTAMAPLARSIQEGRLLWLACPRMREELVRVLGYASLVNWNPDSERVLTFYDRWTCRREAPPPQPSHPTCTDTDDQVFIDMAIVEGARWLITHDRALLRLARRARRHGVQIVVPARWSME